MTFNFVSTRSISVCRRRISTIASHLYHGQPRLITMRAPHGSRPCIFSSSYFRAAFALQQPFSESKDSPRSRWQRLSTTSVMLTPVSRVCAPSPLQPLCLLQERRATALTCSTPFRLAMKPSHGRLSTVSRGNNARGLKEACMPFFPPTNAIAHWPILLADRPDVSHRYQTHRGHDVRHVPGRHRVRGEYTGQPTPIICSPQSPEARHQHLQHPRLLPRL